jgi:hypothetical protein
VCVTSSTAAIRTDSQYDIWRKRDQLRRVFANALGIASPEPDIGPQIATFRPAELLELLTKRGEIGCGFRIVFGDALEHAQTAHPGWLLRPRDRRRNGRCASKTRDELAPPHQPTPHSDRAV